MYLGTTFLEPLKKYKKIYEVVTTLEKAIKNEIVKVSIELEREGYEIIDYYNKDERLIEELTSNDFEFLENGKPWNYGDYSNNDDFIETIQKNV